MKDPIGALFKALRQPKANKSSQKEERREPELQDEIDNDPEDHMEAEGFGRTVTRDDYLQNPDDNHVDSPITSWSAAVANANFQKIINAVLAFTILFCLFMQFQQKPTVVVKPPVLLGDIKIEDGLPNADMKRSWGLFIANTIGNVTPRNVEFASKVVASFLSPELQDATSKSIRQMAQIMKLRGVYQDFNIQDVGYDAASDLVWVWGYKTTKTKSTDDNDGSGSAEDKRKWTYEMIVKFNESGYPKITYLDQYEGVPKFEHGNNVQDGVVVQSQDNKKSKGKKQ